MSFTEPDTAILSICLTCRDGREDLFDGVRGGKRLSDAVCAQLAQDRVLNLELRGVRCMSQCKRACTISLTAPDAFTWIFGDLDPEFHAQQVITVAELYAQSPEGFMNRDERPEPMRSGVLGRLPPIGSTHEIVEPLATVSGDHDQRRLGDAGDRSPCLEVTGR
ncbi:MAG: DUF1636 domain-containing protein [Pseudomonadota bacterium]